MAEATPPTNVPIDGSAWSLFSVEYSRARRNGFSGASRQKSGVACYYARRRDFVIPPFSWHHAKDVTFVNAAIRPFCLNGIIGGLKQLRLDFEGQRLSNFAPASNAIGLRSALICGNPPSARIAEVETRAPAGPAVPSRTSMITISSPLKQKRLASRR